MYIYIHIYIYIPHVFKVLLEKGEQYSLRSNFLVFKKT